MAKINFTKATLDQLALPAAGKRNLYQDCRQPGLSLRVTPSGSKTFYAYKRVKGGSPEMVSIGTYPAITIENARREALRLVGDMAIGKSVANGRRERRQELTLRELFDQFLRLHAKVEKRSWKSDVSNFNLYLGRRLGSRKLSEVTKRQIAALMDEIVADGRSPVTAERAVLSLGRKLYAWAKERGLWSGDNPFAGIKGPKKYKRARFLMPQELPRFFRSLALEPNETIRDFVLLSLLTGQRRGNVQAMKWRNLDLNRAVWEIDAVESKNGEHQAVPLTVAAVEILTRRRAQAAPDAQFVFPGRHSGKNHLNEPKKGWERICLRAEALGLAELLASAPSEPRTADQIYRDASPDSDPRLIHATLSAVATSRNLDTSAVKMTDLVLHDLRRREVGKR